jgi:hypothetical protein
MVLIDGACISTGLDIYDESHWKTHVEKQTGVTLPSV